MNLEADIVIVGGGMAGLVAGTIASEGGLSSIVLRKGESATSMSSGAIDVVGYLPDGTIPFESPKEGLVALASLYPFHPYSILGFGEGKPAFAEKVITGVEAAVGWLKDKLKDSVAKIVGGLDSNILSLSILGTTKPTCLIQETMVSDGFANEFDSTLLFLGVKGYPDFFASAAAKSFLEQSEIEQEGPRKVAHSTVRISPFGNTCNISASEIARHLDHDDALGELLPQIKKTVDTLGATHVALPPILGIKNARGNRQRIEEEVGAIVFELLAFPPSIPGLRLQRALEETYRKSGGQLLLGHEALSAYKEKNRYVSVQAGAPRRSIRISTKAVVSATGKFIGGGLRGAEDGLTETVFNLMTVTGNLIQADNIRPYDYTSPFAVDTGGHSIFSCGLTVDPQFRPVMPDGQPDADNLFAAGSTLAGYDYLVEKSGLGVALVSGFYAGKNAADAAKEVD
ncbi:MAG: anaerobic glycerol-3-phosphate dehydrogenase subunit B [Candidatus Thorarchaeota archaeon]|nr:MAG: anaerobic glycerol-3-phosphate dehydrogenase subunit B [Candidatus Thorarchaeota archaeon]